MGTIYQPIHSNINQDLIGAFFVAKEGLSVSKGVTILEGLVTAREFVDHFSIEASSKKMSEHKKRQRDLESPRAKSLIEYFETRDNTILPNVTIFINEGEIMEELEIAGRKVAVLKIPATVDRLLTDGQNRWNLFSHVLKDQPDLENHTIAVKFVITHTKALDEATEMIRQVFSDYHMKLKKPTQAQNIFFDYSKPLSKLVKSLLEDVKIEGTPLRDYVSVTGKLSSSQLMDIKQLQDLICTATGSTAAMTNKALGKNPEHSETLKQMVIPFLGQFFGMMPLKELSKVGTGAMFNKTIFWQGTAWLIRSIMEDALAQNEAPDFSVMNKLAKLPLDDMTNNYWIENNVVVKIQEEDRTIEYKMIKGSDKSCGRALCKSLRVFYSEAL